MWLRTLACSWLLVSSALAQDFASQIDFSNLMKLYDEGQLCVSASTSGLCRSFPWAPRLHEGVVELNGAAYVFLDSELMKDSEIEKWSRKFAANERLEMTAYFLINNPTFGSAVSRAPYTAIYLLLIAQSEESYKIKSISLTPAGQIGQEVSTQYNVVQGEINGHRGTDWIPPLSFKMGHQFKRNDAL